MYKWYNTKFGKEELLMFDLTGRAVVVSGASSGLEALSAELAKYGITCNCICPGYFATELTVDTLNTEMFQQYMKATVPVGRYGNEGELNSAAIFLAADESAYVTGVILPVDGGYTAI